MIRLLASGDIHLGRSSTALPRQANAFPSDEIWKRLVQKAIDLEVDALLLSGDIIDRENRFFEAIGPLQSGFTRLREAGIPVYMVAGNHDFDVLPDVLSTEQEEGIHLLGAKGTWQIENFSKSGTDIQFVGWSFPTQHFPQDPLTGFPTDQLNSSIPVIGILHGEVAKADSPYAPLEVPRLQATGVNLWVLGHIHKPNTWQLPGCEIRYPGSPQALSPKEQGVHGALLIEVNSRNDIQTSSIPLSAIRYESLKIDLSQAPTSNDIRNSVMNAFEEYCSSPEIYGHGTEQLILDLDITGEHADRDLVDATLREITADYYHDYRGIHLSVRKVNNLLIPAITNLDELAKQSSPAGLIAQAILAIERNESTPLLQTMEQHWTTAFTAVKNGSPYGELQGRGKDQPFLKAEEERRQSYILNACKRLLGELIQQQNA